MTPNLQSLLGCLQDVHQAGETQWEARCPAHDDNRSSLSIALLHSSGTLGVRCHAGCETEAVMGSVNLPMTTLFPPKGRTRRAAKSKGGTIVATYDYRDERGKLEFQAVRFEPKDFRQRKPDGDGGWTWQVKGCRPLLYRLPELLKADPAAIVFVVEGEKDVDNLFAIRLIATCNAGGAGKWKAQHVNYLQGRHVVVIEDNDVPGRKHAAKVAASLVGVAASVKVLQLPGLPEKGDVSDWLKGEAAA